VLERDDAPVSVTTLLAQADGPVRLLGPAVSCYLDAIGFAAERHVGQATKDAIDSAGQVLGLAEADAWPALRSHLMLVAANGRDPNAALAQVTGFGSLETARDPAAVLDYRLDLTRISSRTHGPLPWLPGIPTQLLTSPEWGPYLQARHAFTEELALQTLQATEAETPGWARHLPELDPSLVQDVRLWRAAHNTPDTDLRPTGPISWAAAERRAQRQLGDQLEIAEAGIRDWVPRIVEAVPTLAGDPRLPVLAAKLATLDQTGYDAVRILHAATRRGPLPDDHPADALGYRISNLAERMAPQPSSWETYEPSHRPPHPEPPPSLGPPSHGPSISF